jgi:hypothetical protein
VNQNLFKDSPFMTPSPTRLVEDGRLDGTAPFVVTFVLLLSQ